MFHRHPCGCQGVDSRCKNCKKIIMDNNYQQNKRADYFAQHRKTHKYQALTWRRANKENIKQNNIIYRQENREKLLKYKKQYYKNNYEKLRRYDTEHKKERLKTDINFKLKKNLSARILLALHGQSKSKHTIELLGCSIKEFKTHLEKQFKPRMKWENHGKWHIDHIKPCASFDLTDPQQQEECFNFRNMQPLWATTEIARKYGDFESIGNINKGDKI